MKKQPMSLNQEIQQLLGEDKIVEAGWVLMRERYLSPDSPQQQVTDMHGAFMAGAYHVFGCLMTSLNEGEKGNAAEVARVMRRLSDELLAYRAELEAQFPIRH